MSHDFDAIVVGSGISGGWAAKELCERGLKVALIERGRMVEHVTDYKTELKAPWELPFRGLGDQHAYDEVYPHQQGFHFDEWTHQYWVDDSKNPYETAKGAPFKWRRGYQLGGRSLTWGRHVFRRDDYDFDANAKDGHGIDWPIRYADIRPWYDHVEEFIGVSGARDNVEGMPDGVFQAPFPMNVVEEDWRDEIRDRYGSKRRLIIGRVAHLREAKEGRAPCQARLICPRGCSYGAYFSTQSSTLPAAMKTGNLTVLTDKIVEQARLDVASGRVDAVLLRDARTNERSTVTARLFFINASAFNSVALLLRSVSEKFPNGLGNSSGALGQYIMDHAGVVVMARVPGYEDHSYAINRPASVIIPRFANITEPLADAVRGYAFQGGAIRQAWPRGRNLPGIGADFKQSLKGAGSWVLALQGFIETLPRPENRVTLSKTATDSFGMPQVRIDMTFSENEKKLGQHAAREGAALASLLGAQILTASPELAPPGNAVHEMGGACMGRDPRTSVLNGFNQSHDVPNLFITDGAAMASTGTVNPSLTYMALTARAAAHAVDLLKQGTI